MALCHQCFYIALLIFTCNFHIRGIPRNDNWDSHRFIYKHSMRYEYREEWIIQISKNYPKYKYTKNL